MRGNAMRPERSLARPRLPASVWLMILVAVAIVFYAGIRTDGFALPLDRVPWSVLVPCFALFSFTHSVVMLGWPRAVALLALCLTIAFAAEYVGESTGVIFGPYYYTELLGPKLLGRIPVIIPFAWYMMFYPSYVVTNVLAEGNPVSVDRGTVRIIWMSALGAVVMTAWDLTMDPIMSFHTCSTPALECIERPLDQHEIGDPAWVWEQPGPHFGVPLLNYQGWLLTSFVVFLAFRLLERRLPHRPLPGAEARAMAFLPIAAYGSMSFIDAWLGYPEIEDIRLITPFAMGIPFLFATYFLFAKRTDLPLWPTPSG